MAATVMTVEFGTSQWMASTIIQVRSKILKDWSLFVQFFEQIYTKINCLSCKLWHSQNSVTNISIAWGWC